MFLNPFQKQAGESFKKAGFWEVFFFKWVWIVNYRALYHFLNTHKKDGCRIDFYSRLILNKYIYLNISPRENPTLC